MKTRKPKGFGTKDCYAGLEDDSRDEGMVYIGGPYYESSAQIHLKKEEDVHKLAAWLNKVSSYLKSKRSKK